MAELTAKQKSFVAEYLKDKNATQAAIRAGYSEKTAQQTGSENMLKPVIADAIKEALDSINNKAMVSVQLSKEWILEQLIDNVMIAKAAEPVRDSQGNPTGEYRANIPAANKALELLGSEIGMFIKKVETGGVGDFERMSNDELDKQLAEAERAIGLANSAIDKASNTSREVAKNKNK